MSSRTIRLAALSCVLILAAAWPATSQGGCRLWDCLFGASAPSNTTYAPPFVPAAAPTYVAPSCSPCETVVVPSCTPCVPQTCQYMPAAAYRPVFAPAVVTAYRPVVAAYPLTTYRPFLGTYQTRLVPYTTYRPYDAYYAPAIVYSPVVSACGGCNPCNACGASASYSAPVLSSGCSSCGSPAPVAASSPSPSSSPSADGSGAKPQTFEAEKPAAPATPAPPLKPIPQQENASPSSLPQPILPDPSDRTASRSGTVPIFVSAKMGLSPFARDSRAVEQRAPVRDDGGWQAVEQP